MHRSIAVGIGGVGSWRALAWAVDEAERTGARLVLLHVCVPGSPLDMVLRSPEPARVELVDPNLARALNSARARLGAGRAALRVLSGTPAAGLVDASAGVRLLVIGAGDGNRTVRRVLRGAHCPVVVARTGAPAAEQVVVGIDGSAASHMALEFAFAFAGHHYLPLTAVHVADADPAEATVVLDAETEPWSRKYPAVPVEHRTMIGSVADGLIRAGRGARLLVVGDKRRAVIARVRSGDVPLTVAVDAPCPVAVVPIDQREGEPL